MTPSGARFSRQRSHAVLAIVGLDLFFALIFSMYGDTVPDEIQTLIRRAIAGESAAWETIVSRYERLIWGIFGKYSNTLHQAEREDLYQRVFVILLERGLPQFRGTTEYEFRDFLATTMRNLALTRIRDLGRHNKIEVYSRPVDEQSADDFSDEEVGEQIERDDLSTRKERIEHDIEVKEVMEALSRCMEELSVVDRQVVILLADREESYANITKILNLAQGTIATKYYRAKQKLRECLEKQGHNLNF